MTTVKEIAALVEEQLVGVREDLARAREATRTIETEEKALSQALRALDPESTLVAKPAPAKPTTAAKPPRTQVSEATVERVLAAVLAHPEPVTIAEVAAEVGVSDSAAGNAIFQLRERQLVRKAGRATDRRGMPSLFAAMNGGGDEE